MREKCPNAELFLVRIWPIFTQCKMKKHWRQAKNIVIVLNHRTFLLKSTLLPFPLKF